MAGFLGNLFGLFTGDPLSKAYSQAANAQLQNLAQGYKTEKGDINTAFGQAFPSLQAGITPYQTLFQESQPVVQSYTGAITGAPGAAQEFAGTPWGQDLNYQLPMAAEAAARGAGEGGNVGASILSGSGTTADLINQAMQGWIGAMTPGLQLASGAAGGIQRGEDVLGQEQIAKGEDLASLAQQFYGGKATVQGQLPVAQAQAGLGGAGNALNALFDAAGIAAMLPI